METRVIILLSVVTIVFIINRLYVRADEKRKTVLKDKKTISDNEIISMLEDSLTGEKVNVSETQTSDEYSDEVSDEIVFYDEHRRTSDYVLNKYYSQDGDLEREFILIKNHLLDNGFKFKLFTDSEIYFLEETITFTSFEDWNCSNSYHKDQLSVFIANTKAKSNSRYSSRVENYSIVFWIKDFNFLGHYCFIKKPIVQNIIDVFIDEEKEIIKGYQTEVIKKSHQQNSIKDYFATINLDNDLEIEVYNSNIILRITNVASLENMIKLYDSIKNSD